MPLVSISRAAKLAGISRQYLYDAYIDKGEISIDRSSPKRPKIDTSEILRVFGTLQDDSVRDDNPLQKMTEEKSIPYNGVLNKTVNELTEKIQELEKQNVALQTLADERKDRLDGLSEQAQSDRREKDRLLGILENQTRLLTAAQEQAQKPSVSFWQWLIGRKAA